MKTYECKPLFSQYTGEPTGETRKIIDGMICDVCGVELNEHFDTDNAPWVGFEIVTIGDGEAYFHEDRLQFTRQEALELFEIVRDHGIEIDNYEIFDNNPYVYCRERQCFRELLMKTIKDEDLSLDYFMLRARLQMVDRILRQKLFTPAQLGIVV